MKKNNHTNLCPCQSLLAYESCCGQWHAGSGYLLAPDAVALMRSRYSAYALDLLPYILASWHQSTRPSALEPSETGLKWLGLEIKSSKQIDTTHATVEFIARYRLDGRAHRMHENSRFEKVQNQWFYVDGDVFSS